jgi:hypothetical protein
MTCNLRTVSRMPLLIGLLLFGGLLAGCTTQQIAATPPQPLPALALLQAEQKGYAEGLAAGKRIQARHDSWVASHATADQKAATAPPPDTTGQTVTSTVPAPPAPLPPAVYVPSGPITAIPASP